MKYSILIILLILFSENSLSSQPNTPIEILTSNYWIEKNENCKDWILEFKASTVIIEISCYGSDFRLSGKTKILGNIISFSNLNLDWVNNEEESAEIAKRFFNKETCELNESYDSFKYKYVLQCGNKAFYSRNTPIKPGKEFKIGDLEIVTIGGIDFIATSNVKIREYPSIDSKIIDYWRMYDEQPKKYLPQGTIVKVYARTKSKYKVNDWENYWYYIDVDSTSNVWVFGEFFRKK